MIFIYTFSCFNLTTNDTHVERDDPCRGCRARRSLGFRAILMRQGKGDYPAWEVISTSTPAHYISVTYFLTFGWTRHLVFTPIASSPGCAPSLGTRDWLANASSSTLSPPWTLLGPLPRASWACVSLVATAGSLKDACSPNCVCLDTACWASRRKETVSFSNIPFLHYFTGEDLFASLLLEIPLYLHTTGTRYGACVKRSPRFVSTRPSIWLEVYYFFAWNSSHLWR